MKSIVGSILFWVFILHHQNDFVCQKTLIGIETGTNLILFPLISKKKYEEFSQKQHLGYQVGINVLFPSEKSSFTKIALNYSYNELDIYYLKNSEYFKQKYQSYVNSLKLSIYNHFLLRKSLFFNFGGGLSYTFKARTISAGNLFITDNYTDSTGKIQIYKSSKFFQQSETKTYLDAFLLLGVSRKMIDNEKNLLFIEANFNLGYYSQFQTAALIPQASISLYRKL